MKSKPVVIVTGASRGVGAAAARWLAEVGAIVVTRDMDEAVALADELGVEPDAETLLLYQQIKSGAQRHG